MTTTNDNAVWRLTLDMAVWEGPEWWFEVDREKLDQVCGQDRWFVNGYRWHPESTSGSVCPGSRLKKHLTYVLVRGDIPATMLRMEDGASNPTLMKPAALRPWRNMADEWDEDEVGLFPWEVAR
jgi:hypothetical protein